MRITNAKDIVAAIRAEHLSLASIAYIKSVVSLLEQGGGSRGSYLVLSSDGIAVHSSVLDKNGRELRYKPENKELRHSILRIIFDADTDELFTVSSVAVRPVPKDRKAFEPAWQDYRDGKIFY
jgi:hypothetical protein